MWYACCGGSDVQAKRLVACLLKAGKKEVRTFATLTADLLRLLDWFSQEGGTHVASESRGVCGGRSVTLWKGPWR